MDNVAFIQSGSGTLTIIIGQESFTVATDHPNYFNILNSLEDRNADHLKELIDVPTSVQNYSEGNIRIQEGLFLYEGEELHNTLTERLMKLMVAGHPYQYIVNFLDNLMDNPLFNMSLIFTPGVIAKAPKAIDSIGGGDFISTFEIFFVIHSLINGI